MLRRVNIDADTYNSIFERFPKYIEYVDNLKEYFIKGYRDKRIIKVDSIKRTLIIQAYRINTKEHNIVDASCDWKQVICVLDESLDSIKDVKELPFASVVNKKVYSILHKYYDNDAIDELFESHSLDENVKPLHQLVPFTYHDNKVHKFTNCVYYDINKAHTYALCEIFPLAKEDILRLDKSYVNIFVGDLVNHSHRSTYNWIVYKTRRKLTKLIEYVDGLCLYINTDGAIIYMPKHTIKTCDDIGEFKNESSDGIIYLYVCRENNKRTTPYTIYQYNHPTKGTQLKGNARLSIRKGMNLELGLVNKGKITKKDNREVIYYKRTELVEVYEE